MSVTSSPTRPNGYSASVLAPYRSAACAASLVALGVYLLTLAPDLTWANAAIDGGELITASVTLGIPHPPGYPTYVLLGKLFSLLPVGSIAFRYNLFSAVCAAAAAGLVVLTIEALHPRVRPPAAVAAALLLAFSPLLWSQAVVAEVYSLNLLLLAACLLAWSRGASTWSGLLLGLAITTHLTSLLMLPILLIGDRRSGRALVGLLAGLSPLLLLPLLASSHSPVVWGRPTDASGWWWLISGQLYSANLQPGVAVERLVGWLGILVPGSVLAPRLVFAAPSARSRLIVLGATIFLYGAFALSYATPDAAVLLLPAGLLLALLIPPWLERLGPPALLLPLALAVVGYATHDLSRDAGPRADAEALLAAAPPGAILLTPGDRTIFTLWYFQHVEGQRPDLRLVDANLFAFDWYRERLRALYPDMAVPEGDDWVALQRQNEMNRSICVAGLVVGTEFTPLAGEPVRPTDGPATIRCIEGTY